MSSRLFSMALAAMFVFSASVVAQQPNQPDRPQQPNQPQQTRPAQPAQGSSDALTGFLATKLYLANDAEVQIAKIAQEKATSPEVKEFAAALIQDHEQAMQKLTRFVPAATLQQIKSSGEQAQTRPAQPGDIADRQQPGQPAQRDPAQPPQTGGRETVLRPDYDQEGGPVLEQLQEISIEACKNKLMAAREELNSKSGADFDKCFVGMQVATHSMMVAELDAISDEGNPEFQQLVKTAQTGVKQHLNKAKELAEKMEGAPANPADRTPDRNDRRPNTPDRDGN